MEWLNEGWYALGEGNYFVKTIDCGKLVVPTGQLLICDPGCYLDSEDLTRGVRIQIPVGEYSVILSDEPGVGIVYASLIISDKDETSRKPFLDMPEAIIPKNIDRSNEFVGVPVETGTVCFVDEGALEYGMPPDKKLWDKQVINFEGVDERYIDKMRMSPIADFFDKSMDKAAMEKLEKEAEEYQTNALEEAKKETLESLDKEAIAHLSGEEHWNYLLKNNKSPFINTHLPLASDGANIIMTDKFGGDGYFPVAGSYDAEGKLVAVHIVLYDPRGLDGEDD